MSRTKCFIIVFIASNFFNIYCLLQQEPLPYKYKREIDAEMKGQMTKLQDSLSNLDIALGFLVSVGGDPKKEIHKFMLGNLQMKKGLYGEKV